MPLYKKILGRVFALWAILVFIPTMLVVFIPLMLTGLWKEPQSLRGFQRIARVWMRVFFFLTGIRIVINGKQHFARGQSYIVISNHNSLMDVPLTTPFVPGANKTIAKKEMASIPVFGEIYRRGSVLVDRRSDESRKGSFIEMKSVLQKGMHMCIYPEGTRNKSGKPLQPFHNGAFKLAVDSGHSIIPAVIFNTAKVLPAGVPFFFWPVKIRMDFLEPIDPNGLTPEEVKNKAYKSMEAYYVAHR
jgi:1-acyl-sn-glycerol-3-phosphate acyltransferase